MTNKSRNNKRTSSKRVLVQVIVDLYGDESTPGPLTLECGLKDVTWQHWIFHISVRLDYLTCSFDIHQSFQQFAQNTELVNSFKPPKSSSPPRQSSSCLRCPSYWRVKNWTRIFGAGVGRWEGGVGTVKGGAGSIFTFSVFFSESLWKMYHLLLQGAMEAARKMSAMSS